MSDLPASGYRSLPGGLIIQWGQVEGSFVDQQQVDVPFPTPFPNDTTVFTSVTFPQAYANAVDWLQNGPTSTSNSIITIHARNPSGVVPGFKWVAFGY